MSGPPGLTILLPLEGAPRVWIDVLNDSEERRLWEWIDSRPDLVELVEAALELAARERAA
jgi:hypothetical protein